MTTTDPAPTPAARSRAKRRGARPRATTRPGARESGIPLCGPIEYWPIERVKPNPNNPMRHTPRAIARTVNSMLEFGFTRPLLCARDGDLVAGHRTYAGARKLQLRIVPVVIADHLSPEQVRAYRIADNALGRDSEWDNPVLVSELRALEHDAGDITATGFSDEDLAELERELGRAAAATDRTPHHRGHPSGRILQMLEFDSLDQKERWLEFTAWLRERKPGLSFGAALAGHVTAAMARRAR